jgi:hypothetical protein
MKNNTILKTAEQILLEHLKINELTPDFIPVIAAMEEFAEQETDFLFKLYQKPKRHLKPLEDLWRKMNANGKLMIPDTSKFYQWIVENFQKIP